MGTLLDSTVAEAVADTYARRILAACIRQARSVKDISRIADLPLPTTYRHVNRLNEAGLLPVERSALTEDGKRYDLYRSRIRMGRLEVDTHGERVTWELNEAVEERLAGLWDSLRSQTRR